MAKLRRIHILPISAMLIAGLCAYKLSQPNRVSESTEPIVMTRPAPLFELSDHRKPPRTVRLGSSFIGRHQIVLVFFDPTAGLEGDPNLVWLRQNAGALRNQDVEVFAISSALPQIHRKMLADVLHESEPVPFTMLTVLDEKTHKAYGRFDPETHALLTGVFLIDRAGNLPWNQTAPVPLKDPIAAFEQEFL